LTNGTWTNLGGAVSARAGTGTVLTRTVTVNANTNASYRVLAINDTGSTASAVVTLNNTVAPAAPGNVAVSCRVQNANNARCTVTWTDNSNNNTGFRIQRASNANFTGATNYSAAANAVTFTTPNIPRNTVFYFRVRAFNNDPQTPESAYVVAVGSPITTP
jgi:predicted phage tail protein